MNLRIFAALLCCGLVLCGCANTAKSTSRTENRLGKDFAEILGVPPAQVEITDLTDKDNKISFTATTSKGTYDCSAESASFLALSSQTRNRTCVKTK